MEIDGLIGELLASSRLDFAALTTTVLDACDVARRALARQALDAILVAPEGPLLFRADATLIQRALANLLHNAVVHAKGVDALVVTATDECVRFEVTDRGPGFAAGDEAKAFDAFFRGQKTAGDEGDAAQTHAALGLGLALVQRIAKAHGGSTFAENRDDGPGARVGLEVPLAGAPAAPPSPTAD